MSNRSMSRRIRKSKTRDNVFYRAASRPRWTPIATIEDPEKRREMLVSRDLHSQLDTHSTGTETGLDFAFLGSLHTVLHNVLATWPAFDVSAHVNAVSNDLNAVSNAKTDLQRNPFSATCIRIPPIPKNKRVLVVGCGRGIHVLDIAVSTSHDVEIVAVDGAMPKIEMTRDLLNQFPEVNSRVTVTVGNVHEFKSEHQFDMILDANLVHYFTQGEASTHVQNMVSLLKENGHLFMFWQPKFSIDENDTFLQHLHPLPKVQSEWALNEAHGVHKKGKAVQFKTSTTQIEGAPEIRSIHFQKNK